MKSGIARIHNKESGAISIYLDKDIAEVITLERKAKLKATWNEETKQLIIEEL